MKIQIDGTFSFEKPDGNTTILDLTPEQLVNAQSRPASFVKVSETDYLIFGLPYKANQILEISPAGQQTLDGNKEFYFQKQFQFDHKNNANVYIAEEFKNFQKINKDITKCLLVPVKYEGLYAKTTDHVLPKTYNFGKPESPCDVLCLPFFGNTAASSGVFAFDRALVRNFTSNAGYDTVIRTDLVTAFQQALRALSERVKTK